MKKLWQSLKTSSVTSLYYAFVSSCIFGGIITINQEISNFQNGISMGNLVSSGIFVFFISSILSMILITVPALIGGAVIYHFSYKDIYDHEKYSRYPSIMKGTIIGGAGSLLISIPILTTKVLESHLYSLYMLKLFALIAFIVACVAGALAGRRIHNKLMIEKGSNQ